jgi:hypothetical protein
MRFITQIVRRATRLTTDLGFGSEAPELGERPKAAVHGKSPRARLRAEALAGLI